jgi:PAS domain S-box-containing protein
LEAESNEKLNLLLQRLALLRKYHHNRSTFPRPADSAALVVGRAGSAKDEKRDNHREMSTAPKRNGSADRQTTAEPGQSLQEQNALLTRRLAEAERRAAELERLTTHGDAEMRRYRELFEFAPEAYLITGPDGVILDANQAAAALLNTRVPLLTGQRLDSFIVEGDQPQLAVLLAHARKAQDVEMEVLPRGKPSLHASLALATVVNEAGEPLLTRWLLRDVTERRRALMALDASERRFRAIFSEASLGIVLAELDGRIIRANRAFQAMVGQGDRALFNCPLESLAVDDDKPAFLDAHTQLMLDTAHPARLEQRFRAKDGSLVWACISLSLLPDEEGRPQYLLALVENITGDKQSAAELGEMRRRLLESGEVERLGLAQELHDGPMQDLYGAVFRLSNFLDSTSDPDSRGNMIEIQEILKKVAGTLRRVCGELRPPTLANLGLERAIRSHAERIQEMHPELKIELHLTSDNQILSPHTRLALFRIYQHCISNILSHANASKVVIAFHFDDQQLMLDVWDNGKGFDLPARWVDLMRNGQYGLAGIAERVQALTGELKIDTNPGAGTLVHITAPVELVI